jgi:hypothetical protein
VGSCVGVPVGFAEGYCVGGVPVGLADFSGKPIEVSPLQSPKQLIELQGPTISESQIKAAA